MTPRAGILIFLAAAFQLGAAAADTFAYWVQPCKGSEVRCQEGDEQLAFWAMAAWEKASAGVLKLTPAMTESQARIRVYWVSGREGLYGETRGIARDAVHGADVYVRPTQEGLGPEIAAVTSRDKLFRDSIVYLTVLHESGHALGLPHTRGYEDIMYSFAYGGDILEYFARFRRKLERRETIASASGLSEEDIRRVKLIYSGDKQSRQ